MPEDRQAAGSSFAAGDAVAGLLSSQGAASAPANRQDDVASDLADAESAGPADAGLTPTATFYDRKGGQAGTHLDRYRLETILGRGGMGVVWLAYDPRLNRRVAIKIVRPDANLGPDALTHFLEEGRRLAGLNHADILPVYDCGNDQGVWYLVSEYVPRGTLADQLKRESPSYREAADLVARIAEAAHYAHVRGLVHRDIKPANILIREDGKPLLADFGLAIAEDEQLREAPGTLGTYAYMSPEQMLGESRFVDGRADIYSLGVVLYQLLTGRLPYVASTPDGYRELVLRRDPRPPRSVREDIPVELEAICLKCLARQPADRYTTAADLAAALRQTGPRSSPLPDRWRGIALALATVVLVAIVGGVWRWNQSGAPADPAAGADGKPVDPLPPVVAPAKTPSDDMVAVVELKLSNPATTWEVSPDGESVRFFSDDVVLFQLGDDRSGDMEFDVTIEQSPWLGGMGVFWGYRTMEDDRKRKRFESFTLYPRVKDDEKPRLRNALVDLPDGKLRRETGLALLDFPEEIRGNSHRIGFKTRGGELVDLHWDDMDLSGLLTDRARNVGKSANTLGGFGLIGNRYPGVFLQPTLNGRRIRLAASPKERSSD